MKKVTNKNASKIQRIIRGYFQNSYSSKLENLDEIDKFVYPTKIEPRRYEAPK
jgi:hypothetical protein